MPLLLVHPKRRSKDALISSPGIVLERNPSDSDNEKSPGNPRGPISRKLSVVCPDVLSNPAVRVSWRMLRAGASGKGDEGLRLRIGATVSYAQSKAAVGKVAEIARFLNLHRLVRTQDQGGPLEQIGLRPKIQERYLRKHAAECAPTACPLYDRQEADAGIARSSRTRPNGEGGESQPLRRRSFPAPRRGA